MINVIIIGGGQLGSRHLQALAKLSVSAEIFVVDPFESSLNTCAERFNQVPPGAEHKLHLCKNLHDISNRTFDFAIVATSSDVRSQVTEELIQKFPVKHLLLEKILFQDEHDYRRMLELISVKGIKTHVNCCMRMQKLYSDMKEIFRGERIHYKVNGSQFGLMSNAIHYIDHLAFLSDVEEFSAETTGLAPELFQSKRRGFYELFGDLTLNFKNGSTLNLECLKDGDAPLLFEVYSKGHRFIIRETEDLYWESSAQTNWKWVEKKLGLLFQSALTNLYVEKSLKGENPQLPTLAEATKLHLQFLYTINGFLKVNHITDQFPFT